MPKRGQQKGTPRRRAELIEELRQLGEGPEHIYWPWSEGRNRQVRAYVDGHKVLVHRWVYEQLYGPLQVRTGPGATGDDLVLHKCGVKSCIRPSHLYEGDARLNAVDALRHGHVRRKLSDLDVEHVRLLFQFGVNRRVIGAVFGVHPDYIFQLAQGVVVTGLPQPYAPKRQGHYRRNALAPDDVYRIRRLCAEGAVQARVAAEYGVTRVAINHIVRRKTWRHLPEESPALESPETPAVQA